MSEIAMSVYDLSESGLTVHAAGQDTKATQTLRERDARLRRVIDTMPAVVLEFDLKPTLNLHFVNSAAGRVLGYTPEEFYADPDLVLSLVHPEDRNVFLGMVYSESGEPSITRWTHKDGRCVWIEFQTSAIQDGNGALAEVECIGLDITRRRQLEEQLLRAQRLEAAGRIAAQVAHDFNNLLLPLTTYPELIKMTLPEDHSAIQYCNRMISAARQMVEINQDLLTLSRRGHTGQRPTALNMLARQVLAVMRDRPDTLKVEANLSLDLQPVNGSAAQLLRVVANLVCNAREAMDDVGRLTITTENVFLDKPVGRYDRVEEGEYVRLTVADTGCGIPEEIQDKIFDEFFTTKAANERRGSGLGLSIVRTIVEDHHGYLELDSRVGVGTAFSIYLPVCADTEQVEPDMAMQVGADRVLVLNIEPWQVKAARRALPWLNGPVGEDKDRGEYPGSNLASVLGERGTGASP